MTDAALQNNTGSRWYDRDKASAKSVGLLSEFPFEVLAIVAEGLNDYAERELKVTEQIKNFKSLGTHLILALYKSQKKMRQPDACPPMHKIVNYMMVLSPQGRSQMNRQILQLIEFIQNYHESCMQYQQMVDLDEVGVITNTYVRQGEAEVRQFLAAVRGKFIQSVALTKLPQAKRPGQITEDGLGHTKTDAKSRDMRIQAD
ncbi:MAG: hypothetical protein VKJ06_01305 [Vampirovibrionales bacterium]|nr:hypothetical protein [Vampirovibrionales bacterium]